jgi:hypothetical protein
VNDQETEKISPMLQSGRKLPGVGARGRKKMLKYKLNVTIK